MTTKRYAIVGTGGRCRMFIDAILGKYAEHAQFVGMCDISPTRLAYHVAKNTEKFASPPTPTYTADKFDQMIADTKPDVVIVTTMDCFHHKYIIRAMELGCDAVSEKPMTTDADKANAIFDAIKRTGRKLRVTFNYRYRPDFTKLRDVVASGMIGTPTHVDFQWLLDTSHGADYFRRWHREKDKSGGLLVHKATHHFDLVNWWINSYPENVFCFGDLKFYGKKNAEARGESYPYARYTGVPEAANDPFRLDLTSNDSLKALYLDAEKDSAYIRDRNVFGEAITAEDTMAVTARYKNGVILSYSLLAYTPWEGLRVAITGTKGRVELFDRHGSHIIAGQSDEELAKAQATKEKSLWFFPMFQPPRELEIPAAVGGHGGGDSGVLDRIFNPNPPEDPYKRDASHIDGAASILLGCAANKSIETGLPVRCDDLLALPAR